MGYEARGNGYVTFSREITDSEMGKICDILDEVYVEYDFYEADTPSSMGIRYSGADLWFCDRYRDSEMDAALNGIRKVVGIKEGVLNFTGDDDCIWRYLYVPDDDTWHEQNGAVVYDDVYDDPQEG